jgi:sigma-B regulation protein RsbU (phosphoserine phosphatase)
MTLRAFLVDDEPPARARLRQLLAEAGGVVVVGEAGDAVEARSAIAETRPDVVFLDIEMPQVSGTSLAGSLPEPRPFVVFATAFDRYALDAFAVDATDYLLKPITRSRLGGTLGRVRERLARRSDLERELAEASAAQALLLPRTLITVDGYDSAALTIPARGVGGDFFLSQRIAPHRFVFALGDVSGKGTPAGLIASSLQARLEAVAQHAPVTAVEIVAHVNQTLCATSDAARFATLAYLELDTDRHELTVVNAGHPPLLVLTSARAPRWLASTGPALGILPDVRFDSHAVTLSAGEVIVIYSDGVTEAVNAEGIDLGEEQLAGLVEQHRRRTPASLCQVIVDDVCRHTGGSASDDLTLLAIKRNDHDAHVAR